MISRRMLLLLDLMCLAGVGWAAALIAGLFAGVRLLPTAVAVIVTAVLVLPGFTAGLVTNRRIVRGRKPQSGWIRSVWAPPELPHWGLVLSGLALCAFWIAGMSAFSGMSEDVPPGDTAGQEQLVVYQQRFALGMLGSIGVGGTTLAAASLLRERRSLRTGSPGMAAR
ncbi:hypothetical protein [Actinoplanes sp. NPDC049118]|uniref:hypothetical protein n=1 Tax=Actinoplanes sp. NPDC049118 TaxID=3155769 RepID=UPI0033C2D1D7